MPIHNVRMVKGYFSGEWLSQLNSRIHDALENKSTDSRPNYFYSRPNEFSKMTEPEWDLFVKTEDFKSLIFVPTQYFQMSFEEYVDLKFFDKNEKLRSESTFEIKCTLPQADVFNLIEAHVELMNKSFEQLSMFSSQKFNEKLGVMNHDNFNGSINQIMLLEDMCSDYLQQCLNEGWRIISVSPQPNQRRPDYIMGKHVDKPTGTALRGLD